MERISPNIKQMLSHLNEKDSWNEIFENPIRIKLILVPSESCSIYENAPLNEKGGINSAKRPTEGNGIIQNLLPQS